MPMLYEYECEQCGIRKEIWRQLDERNDPLDCADCAAPMHRVMAAAPTHFKGTGFYKTGG